MKHASRNHCAVIVVSVLATAVTGCAIIDPPSPKFVYEDSSATGSYKLALERAQKISRKFDTQVSNYNWYDFATGAGIFAASAAALAFGVYDAPRPFLLGAGLAAGGLFGIRQFVPWEHRKAIYTEAQGALNCAVQVSRFTVAAQKQEQPAPKQDQGVSGGVAGTARTLAPTDPSSMTTDRPSISTLSRQLSGVRAALAPLASSATPPSNALPRSRSLTGRAVATTTAPEGVKRSAAMLDSTTALAEKIVSKVSDALPSDAERGTRLNAAIDAILVALRKQLAADSFNPSSAKAAVRSEFGSTLSEVRAPAEAGRLVARQLDEGAAALRAEGEAASETVKADANAAAAKAEVAAANIDAQMREILKQTGLAPTCVGNLVGPLETE